MNTTLNLFAFIPLSKFNESLVMLHIVFLPLKDVFAFQKTLKI